MKVAIIGAGALGCYFGARLQESGVDVTLVHYREDYVRAVRENGIKIDSDVDGKSHTYVPITVDTDGMADVDLAMVFVKSHMTESALDHHDDCIGPNTYVLSLQNGLRHYELLRERFGERALGGYTRQAVARNAPGDLHHVKSGQSVFGGPDGVFATNVGKIFEDAGLPCEIADNPTGQIWKKQMISLAIKPTASLTGLRNDQLDCPETREIMRSLIAESVEVAHSLGIDISEEDAMNRVLSACKSAHTSSMLQDIEAGRPTEIDEINGAIVDYAEGEGIDVPCNRIVTNLIRAIDTH